MQELNDSSTPDADGLFLERLDACLKAFAEREHRPLEETRQYVAEWHSKYLFQPQDAGNLASPQDRMARVKVVLSDASRILETLCEASGVQSYLLAVDPSDVAASGFLGGSVLGREYYRGQRGGGDAGVKAFKLHCLKNVAATSTSTPSSSAVMPKVPAARSLKADLYEGVRKALRSASGVRNAEMKWTNPALLATYGVCLVGWPAAIPAQNPSSLKSSQNKELLNALESGTMRFVRILSTANEPQAEPPPGPLPPVNEDTSFSWAIQYDEAPPVSNLSPDGQSSSTGSSEPTFFVWDGGSNSDRPSKRPRGDDDTV
ncbi:hypothetical protein B0H15DRAFT_808711 [Mycena belliarum]|uniref:Uncharacterized protein n=1 Tax=Mycena belliarum TaxID=1033014 RepID=A0AAD6UIC4_9AGAR|nr:hypothetical protein B0H15DRAFT_808711 [Mycena belliae]